MMLVSLATACGFPPPLDMVGDPVDAAADASDAHTVADGLGSPTSMDAPGNKARCDPAKPFLMPAPVESINSALDEFSFSLTRDERTAFLFRTTESSQTKILGTQRSSTLTAFDSPSASMTAAINAVDGQEFLGSPSADGLILYFHRQTMSDIGIYAAVRSDPNAPFDVETRVKVDNAALLQALSATISADGQTLYWTDYDDFGKVRSATRRSAPTDFANERAASTMAILGRPVLSSDELTMFYSDGSGASVLVSVRGSKTDVFGNGAPVVTVNSEENDQPVALTDDGCVLYISSNRPGGLGGYDIWEAHRPM
jgi:hypothetical protein